jgi:hypothetical protein
MPDGPILRAKAPEVIRIGNLPSPRPHRTWGGPGIGAPGAVHGEPIRVDQLESEIEFARDCDYPGLDGFCVHIRYFAASGICATL